MPLSDPIYLQLAQQPSGLFNLLGSYLQSQLEDRDVVQLLEWGRLTSWGQTAQQLDELYRINSIPTVPLGTTLAWYPLVLLRSQLTQSPNVVPYGSGRTYGDGLVYGQLRTQGYVWPIDPAVLEIASVTDQILTPTHCWGPGNSALANGQLILGSDPFRVLASQIENVYGADGSIADQRLVLWARGVQVDRRDMSLRYGAPLGLEGASSTAYNRAVYRTQEALTQGPSYLSFFSGLLETAGLQAPGAGEVVQRIDHLSGATVVSTDKNCYLGSASAGVLVSVGQTLGATTHIFDTVVVDEVRSGPVHTPNLSILVLRTSVGELSFQNLSTSWTFTGTAQAPAIQFPIFGDPATVAAYWAEVQPDGYPRDQGWARLLGVHTASQCPTVNPMTFVLHQSGDPMILVTLRPGDFLRAESRYLARVARLVTAGVRVLFQVLLPSVTDSLDLTGAVDTPALTPALVPGVANATMTSDTSSVDPTVLILSDLQPLLTVS